MVNNIMVESSMSGEFVWSNSHEWSFVAVYTFVSLLLSTPIKHMIIDIHVDRMSECEWYYHDGEIVYTETDLFLTMGNNFASIAEVAIPIIYILHNYTLIYRILILRECCEIGFHSHNHGSSLRTSVWPGTFDWSRPYQTSPFLLHAQKVDYRILVSKKYLGSIVYH
jgi:hypothetical protein